MGKLKEFAEQCQSLEKELEEKKVDLTSIHSLLELEKKKNLEMSDANVELIQKGVANYVTKARFQNLFDDGHAKGFTSCQKWLYKKNVTLPSHIFDEEQVANISLPIDSPDKTHVPDPTEKVDVSDALIRESTAGGDAPGLGSIFLDSTPASPVITVLLSLKLSVSRRVSV